MMSMLVAFVLSMMGGQHTQHCRHTRRATIMVAATLAAIAATDSRYSPTIILAVEYRESGGNPRAVSSKGARGLMQVLPTSPALKALHYTPKDLFDPEKNVVAGLWELDNARRSCSRILKEDHVDLHLVLSRYNGLGCHPSLYATLITQIAPEL